MKRLLVSLGLVLCLGACVETPKAQLTPMQLQALQQREFEAPKTISFASVVSVFQDLGYTVDSADLDTGLITVSSTADSTRDWMWTGNSFTTQTRATAFIESVNEKTSRVRLNFVTGTQTSTAYGSQSKKDNAILDPAVYQSAFEKIETAIFVRQG
tara:strand:+ start:612 stop:1079 length:468 start_codon:yes stop_codon:yes gene_type:complete